MKVLKFDNLTYEDNVKLSSVFNIIQHEIDNDRMTLTEGQYKFAVWLYENYELNAQKIYATSVNDLKEKESIYYDETYYLKIEKEPNFHQFTEDPVWFGAKIHKPTDTINEAFDFILDFYHATGLGEHLELDRNTVFKQFFKDVGVECTMDVNQQLGSFNNSLEDGHEKTIFQHCTKELTQKFVNQLDFKMVNVGNGTIALAHTSMDDDYLKASFTTGEHHYRITIFNDDMLEMHTVSSGYQPTKKAMKEYIKDELNFYEEEYTILPTTESSKLGF